MFNELKFAEIKDLLKKKTEFCQIIAVSKNHPKESVKEAIQSGVFIFGENRVLEAKHKFVELKKLYPEIELHLTGPLQSNKVKEAVKLFDVFHTLDREKIAVEFSKYQNEIKNKKIFIQVNTGEEQNKSGVSPKQLRDFVNFCLHEQKLKINGLMCIPPMQDDPKIHFKMLQELANSNNLRNLSIGMSGDYLQEIGRAHV